MKKIIIFILFVSFVFADSIYVISKSTRNGGIYAVKISTSIYKNTSYICSDNYEDSGKYFKTDSSGNAYQSLSSTTSYGGYNWSCVSFIINNFHQGDWGGCTDIYTATNPVFKNCLSPGSDYKWMSCGWLNTKDGSFIPLPGYEYNSTSESCYLKPQCPTGSELDDLAIKKCGSLDWTQTETCDPNTGDINITCKSCSDVYAYVKQYCSVNYDANISNFSCTENADGSLSVSVTPDELNSSVCLIKNSDNNTSDSTVTDNKFNDTDSSSNSDSSVSSNTNTSSNSGSSVSNNSNNVNNDNNNNNVCPDPCYLYEHKPLGFQISTSVVDGYTCNTVTYPVYNNCNVQYHIVDGKCISGCGNSVASGSSGDGNISINLSPVTSRLDKTNQKLTDIDKTLNDIKNMKPDGNFSVNGTSSLADSFISQYSDFFNNLKSDISNLQNSYNNAKNVLNKDNYSLNLDSSTVSCPISTNIYGRNQSVDVCKFVSPYKPFISLAFTFFFNLSVILFFLKLIISSRSEL